MLALRTTEGKVVEVAGGSKSWPLANTTSRPLRIFARNPDVLQLLGGQVANYSDLYWSQPWVHAVVNKLTRGMARLELKTYSRDDGGALQEEYRSVPAKVLRNPYPRAGAFQLKEFIMGSLCVYGNATLVKFRGGAGQTPAELWPMPFQRVTIIQGADVPIAAYRYDGISQKPIFLVPEDVMHFTWFNPDGKPWGRSPLEALQTTLALEDAGQRYALAHFGNNARPASFIVSDKSLTKEQRDNLRAEIDAAYAGPDNAFKVALLDNGLDWKPITGSGRDPSLTENRKLSREEVCAVLDMAPPLVGILDNATYSNIDTQVAQLYQETFGPKCAMIEDTFNAQFYNEASWSGLFGRFDMGEIVRGNFEQRTQGYQRMFQSSMKTPNELRHMNGDPPYGDPNDKDNPANKLYYPVNMAPDGEKILQTAPPKPAPILDPTAGATGPSGPSGGPAK